jgi:hypothetical protein
LTAAVDAGRVDLGSTLRVNSGIGFQPARIHENRHCEEAKPTKQSSSFFAALDCFAALAMTVSEGGAWAYVSGRGGVAPPTLSG